MMDLFLTNTQLLASQDINWWTAVVWITSGLWRLYQLWTLCQGAGEGMGQGLNMKEDGTSLLMIKLKNYHVRENKLAWLPTQGE